MKYTNFILTAIALLLLANIMIQFGLMPVTKANAQGYKDAPTDVRIVGAGTSANKRNFSTIKARVGINEYDVIPVYIVNQK